MSWFQRILIEWQPRSWTGHSKIHDAPAPCCAVVALLDVKCHRRFRGSESIGKKHHCDAQLFWKCCPSLRDAHPGPSMAFPDVNLFFMLAMCHTLPTSCHLASFFDVWRKTVRAICSWTCCVAATWNHCQTVPTKGVKSSQHVLSVAQFVLIPGHEARFWSRTTARRLGFLARWICVPEPNVTKTWNGFSFMASIKKEEVPCFFYIFWKPFKFWSLLPKDLRHRIQEHPGDISDDYVQMLVGCFLIIFLECIHIYIYMRVYI